MRIKSKKNLKNKCDTLYSQIIRLVGKCEFCSKTSYLQSHHVIGRINYILRWDLRNGICLCSGCHMLNKFSAHQDPLGFMEWFKSYRPEDYEYLRIRKNEIRTFTVLDYEEIYQELKEEYERRKQI